MVKTVYHTGEYTSVKIQRYKIEIPYINHVGFVKSDVEINPYIQNKYLYIGARFKYLKAKFVKWVLKKVPIRTGKLADTMMESFRVFLTYASTNKWQLNGTFNIPDDRPRIIHGKTMHSYPDEGWGKKYTPKSTEITGHVVMSRPTKKGAYYRLNDPASINRYEQAGQKVMENILVKDAQDFLRGIKITMEYKK